MVSPVIIVVVAAIVFFVNFVLVSRYKRCPSDKILVIYGRTGGTSAKMYTWWWCIYLACSTGLCIPDLKPLSIEANLTTNALSRQNIRVDVPCRFTIAISTEADNMNTAAERLLDFLQNRSRNWLKTSCSVSCVWSLLP